MKIYVIGLAIMFSLVNVSYGMSPIEFGKSVGANETLINELREACQSAKNPAHCFGVGLSISNAESGMCNNGSVHGCFGLVLSNGDKSAKDRVARYNKYRYKAINGFYFYGDRGQLSKTRYCTSEHSSKSEVGCPNGRKNFDLIYDKYKEKVTRGSVVYDPPLDQNIEEPTHKKECTRVANIDENQYVQIDTRLGQLWQMIFPRKKSKVFICNNNN